MAAGQAGRVSDAERIADLERELRQRDEKIAELKTEHDEMHGTHETHARARRRP